MAAGTRVAFANTLRGVAALSVLISHYFGAFWTNRPVVAALVNADTLAADVRTPWIVRALDTPDFSFGAFGVALFFVISGFVIPFSLIGRSAGAFAAGRALRLLPTYAAGFTVTLLALALSGWVFGRAFPFTAREVAIHYLPGLRDLLWSPGIDGIVWTLEVEVKFYVFAASVAVLLRRADRRLFLVFLALAAGIAALHLAMPRLAEGGTLWRLGYVLSFSGQFIVFMGIGTVAHFVHRGVIAPWQGVLYAAGLFAVFALLWRMGIHAPSFAQVQSYGFAAGLFWIVFAFPAMLPETRLARFFADISYPLYVVHGVAGYVMLRLLLQAGTAPMVALLLTTGTAIAAAWLLHRLVEAPTQRLASAVGRRGMRAELQIPAR